MTDRRAKSVEFDPNYFEPVAHPRSMLLTFTRPLSDDEQRQVQQSIDRFVDWDRKAVGPSEGSSVWVYEGCVWQDDQRLVVFMQFGMHRNGAYGFGELALQPVIARDRLLGIDIVAGPVDVEPPPHYVLTAVSGPRAAHQPPTEEQLAAAREGSIKRRNEPSEFLTIERDDIDGSRWEKPRGFRLDFSRSMTDSEQGKLRASLEQWRLQLLDKEGFDISTDYNWSASDSLVVEMSFFDLKAWRWMLRALNTLSDDLDTFPEHTVIVRPLDSM